MARTFEITTEGNAAKIVVDGNEISDVIECNLRKNNEGTILEIKIAITGDVSYNHKPIKIPCAQTYGTTSVSYTHLAPSGIFQCSGHARNCIDNGSGAIDVPLCQRSGHLLRCR